MGRLFFDAALMRVTSYLRDMHPGGMDIFAPVFVCLWCQHRLGYYVVI